MSDWAQAFIALFGAGGSIAAVFAWLTAREARKNSEVARKDAAEVRSSIGPQNGHGTVQDATGRILDELTTIKDMQQSQGVSLRSVVDAASTVGDRLKAHDRELADHGKRITALEREATS